MGGRRETDRQIDRWTVKWRKISVCSSVHLFVCLSVQYVLLPALLSIHPSVHPSDCLSVSTYVFQSFGCTYIHLSVPLTARPPARPSVRPSPSLCLSSQHLYSHLSVVLFVHPLACPFVCPPINFPVGMSASHSVHPSINLSAHPSVYTCQSFSLSIHQFVCLSTCL